MSILNIHAPVKAALAGKQAVVALESTIITHGMPYPHNRDTALMIEATVRENGAVPATIAVIDGALHIGLEHDAIDNLAQASDVMKLSRADLAVAMSRGVTGSTTVAATMMAATRAGIQVFATGGIGGVHRGAEQSFDISADLTELSQTSVTVICAGAKAILDLPKTFEVLETLGVPVMSYQHKQIPAFWSRDSGIDAPLVAKDIQDIVQFMNMRAALDIKGGILITNPLPIEAEIPREEMEGYIKKAITDAESAGIRGKDVTPWLLGRIVDITDGRSLSSNKALINNNAALAARIAAEVC